jgi:hypothetical protein
MTALKSGVGMGEIGVNCAQVMLLIGINLHLQLQATYVAVYLSFIFYYL